MLEDSLLHSFLWDQLLLLHDYHDFLNDWRHWEIPKRAVPVDVNSRLAQGKDLMRFESVPALQDLLAPSDHSSISFHLARITSVPELADFCF